MNQCLKDTHSALTRRASCLTRKRLAKSQNIPTKKSHEDGRKFANLVKIRAMPGAPPIGSGGCSITGTTGSSLSIHYGTSDIDVIHVSNAGVDELLAALTTLAPQAKLIEGMGI